jgi:hypothetical protein
MEDSNRILEQKALRNVRALVDKLESLEPAHPWRPFLLLIALALVVGFVMWIAGSRKAAVEAAARQQQSCEFDVWVAKAGDLERNLRQAHPGMTGREIQKSVERERPAIIAAAKAECDRRSR